MKELSIEEKAKAYDEAIKRAQAKMEEAKVFDYYDEQTSYTIRLTTTDIFPELKESEDERISKEIIEFLKGSHYLPAKMGRWIAWLEKQGGEPNWCHHKVDLSNCSEEYRKAYYDGWNNCNMQHSQCRSESDDVIKCLINGMEFYYEDNEEATWGPDKWSMPVKHIIEVLEQILANSAKTCKDEQKPADSYCQENCRGFQETGKCFADGECKAKREAEQKTAWSEEDKNTIQVLKNIVRHSDEIDENIYTMSLKEKLYDWLKSLRPQNTWKPSEEQMEALKDIFARAGAFDDVLLSLINDLKKLKG